MLALALAIALAAEALGWVADPSWGWLALPLSLLAIALSGVGTYRNGAKALLRGDLDISALMAIAVTGALILGHWPEAAMVMVLFTMAEAIEERSLDKARHAVEKLLQAAPATVWVGDGAGNWVGKAPSQVSVGSLLRVGPGERIGLDGSVVAGRSAVNQASITGESMPVDKQPGDAVYAGSVNGMGELQYRSEAAYDHTLLARIMHAVQQAQRSKAPVQRFVDSFARIYTPAVCLAAAAIALAPPLFFGAAWSDWIYKALVLLVIACPCALVISTPVAVVSGLAAAARHGILIKGGAYLELGRKLEWLALDKTGTLTRGEPRLVETVAVSDALDEEQCRRVAASLARLSSHPVSQAIASAWPGQAGAVQDFHAAPGGGVSGRVDGVDYFLGSEAWVGERLAAAAARHVGDQGRVGDVDGAGEDAGGRPSETLARLREEGRSISVLASPQGLLALFAVADTIKPSSREAVAELHALGVRCAMLSGDNPQAAANIAAQAGIDDVRAGLLPEDKQQAVRDYAGRGAVGMVGDGINDAPALALADIGFAMGAAGTDAAIETADVALMDDDLRKIPRFIRLSRATRAVLTQNICFALGTKLAFVALTMAGLGTMWMAVFADVGASLLVVANSLRLLRK